MKKILLTAALSLSSFALASSWEIDSTHASANFSVKHMTITNVTGTLGPVTGKIEVDDKDITKSKIEATMDVKGIDTKNQKRDDHLRSKEFFEAEKFPTVTFKSTKIEKGGADGKLKITGDLTMHGVTKSVVLDAELTGEVANPFSKAITRAVAGSTTVNRKDFGLVWNMPMANNGLLVGEDVKVSIEAELVKKDAAPAPAPMKK